MLSHHRLIYLPFWYYDDKKCCPLPRPLLHEQNHWRKNKTETFPALQEGIVSSTGRGALWSDRGKERRRWEEWSSRVGDEERRKARLCSRPPFAFRKPREAAKWHGVHPNDEWWIAEQRGALWEITVLQWENCTHTHTSWTHTMSSLQHQTCPKLCGRMEISLLHLQTNYNSFSDNSISG